MSTGDVRRSRQRPGDAEAVHREAAPGRRPVAIGRPGRRGEQARAAPEDAPLRVGDDLPGELVGPVVAVGHRGRGGVVAMGDGDPRVAVVMITYNRREEVLRTLEQVARLPEAPRTVVVDNGSTDGTAAAVAARFPQVEIL